MKRPAETATGEVEHLAKPGQNVQAAFECFLHRMDPQLPVGVEQVAAVQKHECADVLRPCVVGPKDQLVIRGEPVHHHRLFPAVAW
ncbi:hypothetical protein SRABI83_00215 [Arthrobacter sp. Bi83]|jgi:hypothetical protein|uniref:hypothetical protein n=1 Tax=Arthrobacter sp. Bi83 TaxID=2822353 RepID=UPI001D3A1512|nr:hypothetical protein [Arthrobacter sp. Bi83]CAH0129990.1 hypothetical protein SRABI83_00215 [Arthrobacter sp. Bi83]